MPVKSEYRPQQVLLNPGQPFSQPSAEAKNFPG
jgi:hypothetical protein